MHNFKLYRLAKELEASCDISITAIQKICTTTDQVYLLTSTKQLFYGLVNEDNLTVHFILIREAVADVDLSPDSLFIVGEAGWVQKCTLLSSVDRFKDQWIDVDVVVGHPLFQSSSQTNVACDNRRWSAIGQAVRVVRVNCNHDGVLFTTSEGELYGMGSFADVCVSEQPIIIPFFADYEVIQVATGKHFVVVLTRRRQICYRSTSPDNVNSDTISLSSISSINTVTTERSVQNQHHSNSSLATPEAMACTIDASQCVGASSTSWVSSQETLGTVTPVRNVSPKTLENVECESSSSENVSVVVDVENEIKKLLKLGSLLIRSNVWSFGSINKGQLGTGDHIRRKHAIQILSLNEQGVQKISCGDEHTAALTIDGRLYLWGDNGNEQISHWLEKEDFSSPKRYHKSDQNVLDVNCGQFSTYILTNSLERCELSRNKHFSAIPLTNNRSDPLHVQDPPDDEITDDDTAGADQEPSRLEFLANGAYLLIGESNFDKLQFEHYLKYEQEFLQDILQKVAPFFPKFLRPPHRNVVKHPPLYKQFFTHYNSIISITAVNIQTMNLFSRGSGNSGKLGFIRHVLEYIAVYRMYAICYCAIVCSDDYKRMCDTILPNTDFEAKFSTPLHHFDNYIAYAEELAAIEPLSAIKSAFNQWKQFKNEMDLMLESAEQTVLFWRNNNKALPASLHVPERRFIQDSKQVPLKMIPASRFTSHWLILFNDIFCVCSGSTSVKQYALNILWVSSVADREAASATLSLSPSLTGASGTTRRYALEIITPEERFIVGASSLEAKFKWLDVIERYVRISLGRPERTARMQAYRVARYTFSDKNKTYPKCRYTGCWFAGQLHGNGLLEFPDGRVFTGQFSMGVISGFGRWIVPGISCYEGIFNCGKYHGYGTLEIQSQNGTYEGSFKVGMEHGHGVLINDQITYIGEFANGTQNGFGVLDNAHTGEKYMGLFAENKKNGRGFCITVDGEYFEGTFVDDELCGTGVAVFTDGSYYEGELTMQGPNGRGILYLPREPVRNEVSKI